MDTFYVDLSTFILHKSVPNSSDIKFRYIYYIFF